MIRRRGFTLVEVLVALVIVALATAAVLTALHTAAVSAMRQRERLLAGQVAMNRITETRIEPEWPLVGRSEGISEMGGRRWQWRQDITRTPFEGVLQITVQVRSADAVVAKSDDGWVVTLTGARGRSILPDTSYDRLWDNARREGG